MAGATPERPRKRIIRVLPVVCGRIAAEKHRVIKFEIKISPRAHARLFPRVSYFRD
jgi:hypothetical protein